MALVYDNTRSSKNGGGWIERADPMAWVSELSGLRDKAAADLARSQGRWHTADKLAFGASAIPFAAAASPLLAGTGAASATTPGIVGPMSSGGLSWAAPAAAKGFSLSSFLNAPATGLGLNAITGFLGQRSANNAAKQASQAQLLALDKQLAADAENRAQQMQQFTLSQNDARAANDASNALRRQELASAEEERAFSRKLLEDREARLAPYRATAERARMSLASFLGM